MKHLLNELYALTIGILVAIGAAVILIVDMFADDPED